MKDHIDDTRRVIRLHAWAWRSAGVEGLHFVRIFVFRSDTSMARQSTGAISLRSSSRKFAAVRTDYEHRAAGNSAASTFQAAGRYLGSRTARFPGPGRELLQSQG